MEKKRLEGNTKTKRARLVTLYEWKWEVGDRRPHVDSFAGPTDRGALIRSDIPVSVQKGAIYVRTPPLCFFSPRVPWMGADGWPQRLDRLHVRPLIMPAPPPT